jgi:uncharacterized protein YbcI
VSDRSDQPEGPGDPGDAADRRGPPSTDEVQDEISREILRIHEESYGKGAGETHVFVSQSFVVVVLDDLELLPNEQFLLDNGHGDTVTEVRSRYQQAIQTTFRAAIERATGRTVSAFASATSIEKPAFVAEIFKLE